MDPVTAALLAGSLGFGAATMLGGKKKSKSPPMPSLSPMGNWAQSRLYENVGRGLEGKGLTPWSRYGQIGSAYKKAYPETQKDLESYMNRVVPRADTGVRDWARGALARSHHTTLQDLKEEDKLRPYEEQLESMELGTGLLAQEKRVGASITGMSNQYNLMQNQMPTFASNLAYGVGSAGGWASAAQRWSQMMGSQ